MANSLGGIGFATAGTPFAYDPATFTATWKLGRTFFNEKIVLTLDGDAVSGGVTDSDNDTTDLLGGEWVNPAGTPPAGGRVYPSGNGTAAGDFGFSFRVLPADFNRDGAANLTDFGTLRGNFNGVGKSVLQGDANGDGTVNLADFGALRGTFGKSTHPGLTAATGRRRDGPVGGGGTARRHTRHMTPPRPGRLCLGAGGRARIGSRAGTTRPRTNLCLIRRRPNG